MPGRATYNADVTEPDNKLQALWHEFVRRRVVRVAIFYGALAWILVQVADIVLEAFEADAALKYVIAVVLIGFPVAIVLSWMFDITPRGIERTAPLEPSEASRRSIAVLPFSNLSDDPGNEYFSDGLSEEIRDQLARVPGLRVAARTSSFAFKGRNEDAREIGRRLDVGMLLEGGVRKYRDTLRISAQLVDTQRGYQVWSETFDRRLEDVFALQREISRAILEAVNVRVLDIQVTAGRTDDFEAYNLYLHGRYCFHKRTESSLNRAVEYFRQAILRDPDYAQSYCGLSDATCLLSTDFYGNLMPADAISKAMPATERALAIAPNSAEAHASMGLIRSLQRNLDAAAASFERAIQLDSNYALAHVWLGLVLLAQGRFREAEERNLKALRLDPLSPIVNANAGFDAMRLGRDDEAEAHFRNVIDLDASFAVAYSGMARLHADRGRLDEALAWQNKAIERAPRRCYYLARKGYVYLQLGKLDLAGEWLHAATSCTPDSRYLRDALVGLAVAADDRGRLGEILDGDDFFGSDQQAVAALLLGDEARARSLYGGKFPDHRQVLLDVVSYELVWRIPHVVYRAMLELRQGNTEASRELEKILDTLDGIRRDGVVNAETSYWAATALAVLGRTDDAISRLDEAVRRGWRNVWWARRDPSFAALREDPRFQSRLADAEQQIGLAAERVRDAK